MSENFCNKCGPNIPYITIVSTKQEVYCVDKKYGKWSRINYQQLLAICTHCKKSMQLSIIEKQNEKIRLQAIIKALLQYTSQQKTARQHV